MNFYEKVYKKEEKLIISNDAYHYLLNGETCLDDNNKKEADFIIQRLGLNYDIVLLANEPEGDVSVLIKPFEMVKSSHNYTKYIELFNNWQIEIEQLNAKKVYIRFHNTKTGKTSRHQKCEIQYLDKGRTQFTTDTGSIYPLWDSQSNKVKNFNC